jgi:hypothetical protein
MPPSSLLAAMKRLRSLSVNRTAKRFSANTGPTFLFTMTSQPSTQPQDQLTLFAVDSPVKTSAQQASKPGSRKAPAPAFFTNSCESFAWWDRNTSSWRTSQRSLLTDWTLFSERWPKQGLMRNGHVFRQQMWAPVIEGIGGGLLPTPRTCSAMAARLDTASNLDGERFPNLETVVARRGLLPTPTTQDHKRRGPNSSQQGLSNTENWTLPTPLSMDHKGAGRDGQLPTVLTPAGGGTYLNPSFVEEMMGFPIGWTVLKP